MEKRKYIAPGLNRSLSLEMEQAILGGSVVDVFNEGGVETTGQEVQPMNFADETQFSHNWD